MSLTFARFVCLSENRNTKKIQNSKIFETFFKVFVRFFPPILRKLKASIFLRVAKQPSHYQKIQKYIFFEFWVMGDVSAMPENMFYPGVSLFLQSFVPFFLF